MKQTTKYQQSTMRFVLQIFSFASSHFQRLSISILVILILMSLPGSAFAQTKNWIGGAGNWNVVANWNPAGIPSIDDNVIISSSSSIVTIPVNISAGAKSVQISGGAELNIAITGSLETGNASDHAIEVDDSTLNNAGSIFINASGTAFPFFEGDGIRSQSNSNIMNSGTITIPANAVFISDDGISNYSGSTIINTGLIDLQRSGSHGINNDGGTITNSGTINIGTEAGVSIGNYCIRNRDAGTFANNGTVTLDKATTRLIAGGTDLFQNNANGIIYGTGGIGANALLNNDGTLSPGYSPGIQTINGAEDFSNSTMKMEINGPGTAGTNFDQIVVQGEAILGGTLEVIVDFSPNQNDEIIIVDANSLNGTFSTVIVEDPNDQPLQNWDIFYDYPNAGEVTMRYSVPPSISSVSPDSGPRTGGTEITITGDDFGLTQGTSTVTIDGTNCNILSWNNQQIVCETPANLSGEEETLIVTTEHPISASSTFTYYQVYEGCPGLSMGVFTNGFCPTYLATGHTFDDPYEEDSNNHVWYWFQVPAFQSPVELDFSSLSGSHEVVVYNNCGGSILISDTAPATHYLDQGTYYILVYSDPGFEGFFNLCLEAPAILPVDLINFLGKNENDKNILSWETASEQSNDGFFVERSIGNNNDWQEIGFVTGKGTTDDFQKYTFTDERPIAGINYYRLRQVDFDGETTFSKIISVEVENDKSHIGKVYPNPVDGLNGPLTLPLVLKEPAELQLQLYNQLGQLVSQYRQYLDSGSQLIPMAKNELQQGIYLLHISIDSHHEIQQIVVK